MIGFGDWGGLGWHGFFLNKIKLLSQFLQKNAFISIQRTLKSSAISGILADLAG